MFVRTRYTFVGGIMKDANEEDEVKEERRRRRRVRRRKRRDQTIKR